MYKTGIIEQTYGGRHTVYNRPTEPADKVEWQVYSTRPVLAYKMLAANFLKGAGDIIRFEVIIDKTVVKGVGLMHAALREVAEYATILHQQPYHEESHARALQIS